MSSETACNYFDLQPGSVWQRDQRNGIIATIRDTYSCGDGSSGQEDIVVYHSSGSGKYHFRKVSDFLKNFLLKSKAAQPVQPVKKQGRQLNITVQPVAQNGDPS